MRPSGYPVNPSRVTGGASALERPPILFGVPIEDLITLDLRDKRPREPDGHQASGQGDPGPDDTPVTTEALDLSLIDEREEAGEQKAQDLRTGGRIITAIAGLIVLIVIGIWSASVLVGLIAAGVAAFFVHGWFQGLEEEETMQSKIAALPDFAATLEHTVGAKGIFLDANRRKVALYGVDGPRVYTREEIVGAELVVDDKTVLKTDTKTRRGSQITGAALGGLVAGGAGLLAGGLTGRRQQESWQETTVSRIAVRVHVRDLRVPQHEITFFKGNPKPVDSGEIRLALSEASEWHDRIQLLASDR